MRIVAYPAYWNRTLNPYNALLYESMTPFVAEISEYMPLRVMPRNLDVFHVHWPDRVIIGGSLPRRFGRSALFLTRLALAKARGARVVWTVHNLKPHEPAIAALRILFWPLFFRILDGAIYLSETSRSQAFEYHPALRSKRSAVIPHGHYRPMIASAGGCPDREEARRALDLPRDKFVFLYFGQIRNYKNIPRLVSEFISLTAQDVTLLIVGSAMGDEDVAADCRSVAGEDRRVRFDFRHVPDDLLLKYIAACNIAVLPYREVLNSGSVLMALSAHRSVIAPRIGSIAEIAGRVGASWMRCYDGDFTASVLIDAMGKPLPETPGPDLKPYDWLEIARGTVDFYRSLREETHPQRNRKRYKTTGIISSEPSHPNDV
jgi:glycosyltransferase involved in cell wall biosynthesis